MRTGTQMLDVTSAAMLLASAFAFPAAAHDPVGHAAHHEHFYKHLKQPGTGISCCNDQDCRPAPHRITPNGVEFYVAGKWFMPPADRLIQTDQSPISHWCGWNEQAAEPTTYCAVIPRPGV